MWFGARGGSGMFVAWWLGYKTSGACTLEPGCCLSGQPVLARWRVWGRPGLCCSFWGLIYLVLEGPCGSGVVPRAHRGSFGAWSGIFACIDRFRKRCGSVWNWTCSCFHRCGAMASIAVGMRGPTPLPRARLVWSPGLCSVAAPIVRRLFAGEWQT